MNNMISEPSLQTLPVEVLVNIFSHLDELDFRALEQTCKLFEKIVHDEELWKTLFLQKNSTLWFPSFSRTNLYSIEYVERNTGLNQWRHNRAIKTKYSITHDVTQQTHDISSIVFDFPRCACYNEGMVTFLQLHTKRRKDRVAYIQCTTPHGTSARHFNINAVVFGRYDGRVFGKLLTNKSYLSPVTEFDGRHFAAVTAIITTAYQDSSDDICVSGDESGEIIWWRNTHKERQLKISTHPIADLHVNKGITIAIDLETIFVIDSTAEVHSINLQRKTNVDFSACKFIKVDFGGKNIIFATLFQVYVISIDIRKDFGSTKVMNFDHPIQELSIDESTAKKERDPHLPGGDGCFVSVLTEDRTVYTINVRVPGSELKCQTRLAFNENWITCQINNLVLVCAFSGMIGIYDAITGNEIRVIQNTEPYPEFLNISHGQILVGKGTTLFYYQYVSEQDNSKKKKGGNKSRSNKWNENLQQQLNIYDDDEQKRIEENNRMAKLQKKFVGDIDDEELQFKIALLESESLSNATQHTQLDTSGGRDRHLVDSVVSELLANDEDIDEDFLRALQESTREENRDKLRKKHNRQPVGELEHIHTVDFTSDTESLDEETKRQIAMMDAVQEHREEINPENDDDLALAIALSLSQMNDL